MIINTSLLCLTEPEMLLDSLLFRIAFDIRDVVYDHKNKPKYDR